MGLAGRPALHRPLKQTRQPEKKSLQSWLVLHGSPHARGTITSLLALVALDGGVVHATINMST
jgi:hypothetical protein